MYPDDATPLNPLGQTDDPLETFVNNQERDTPPVRRSARENRGVHPNRFDAAFGANLEAQVKTPKNVQKALNSLEKSQWRAAMAAEMGNL